MKKNHDSYDLLSALGVSFKRDIDISLSPEECFLSLIEDHEIIKNKRLLSLAILSFKNLQDYLRPDLFKRLIERRGSKTSHILGGIIFRDHLKSPSRWIGLKKKIKTHIVKKILFSSEDLLEARGKDSFFSDFHIEMTPVLESGKRKLFGKKWFFSRNPWIKNRIFMGPSTRADVYTVKKHFLESNAYRFMERFNYTPSSLYGIWNEIEFAQDLGAWENSKAS